MPTMASVFESSRDRSTACQARCAAAKHSLSDVAYTQQTQSRALQVMQPWIQGCKLYLLST